jgi:hypothetical protein
MQLMLNNADGVKDSDLDILYLWNRAANRIDFYQPPNE